MKRRSFFALPAGLCALPVAEAAPGAERPFQLGCVTYSVLKDRDLPTLIRTLETTGLAAVELRTGHKHGVEPSLTAPARARDREQFQKSKVKLLSYGSTCEFQSTDQAERAKQIELAKAFVDLARYTGPIGLK